jgi:predicted transcriptional regulator
MTRKRITVSDVMQTAFNMIDGKDTIDQAIHRMTTPNSNMLIVKKRDDNDEFGILLLADIAKKILAKDRSPERVNVYEIMSKPAITVRPDMDIRYCARMFEQFGLAKAPVEENGKIVGIVSYDNMVLKGYLLQNQD